MTGKSDIDNLLDKDQGITVQPRAVFTDKNLFDLYAKLKESYCPSDNSQKNFDRMSIELFAEFLPGGIYADMDEADQKKIYTVFTTFLNAQSPADSRTNAAPRFQSFDHMFRNFRHRQSRFGSYNHNTFIVHHHHYEQSSWFHDYLFWHWMFSDTSSSRNNTNSEDWLKLLLVLIVAAVAAVILYFAACYLFTAIAESLERFWYNEGWLQASISLLGVIGGAVAGAMLMMTFLPPFFPLATLCIAFTSTVTAAITGGVTNLIQAQCIESMNADAMDSADPYRFTLTEAESAALEQKGIDPTKVKCAIAALRHEIRELPSLTSRWFSDTPQQVKLQLIRALRRGEMAEVRLEGLSFDLRVDRQPEMAQAANDGSVDGVPIGNAEFNMKQAPMGYMP